MDEPELLYASLYERRVLPDSLETGVSYDVVDQGGTYVMRGRFCARAVNMDWLLFEQPDDSFVVLWRNSSFGEGTLFVKTDEGRQVPLALAIGPLRLVQVASWLLLRQAKPLVAAGKGGSPIAVERCRHQAYRLSEVDVAQTVIKDGVQFVSQEDGARLRRLLEAGHAICALTH